MKVSRKKVFIIGAGISGLAACDHLIQHGFDARILEARDRSGGRISTDNSLGLPVSRGAAWVHGADGNPITQLAESAKVKLVESDFSRVNRFDRHGNLISQKDWEQFEKRFADLLEQAKQYAIHNNNDVSLSSAFSKFIKADQLSTLEQDMLHSKISFFENYMGASYEKLSARHWDQEETWPGNNCFLAASYGPIIDNLAKKCPIQLNCRVRQVNARSNDIEIITDNEVFYADAVIVTVPLGVLKKQDILFNPPLPPRKQQAIENLGMGLLNVIGIKFSTVFWPADQCAMFFSQPDSLSINAFINLFYFIQQPILLGYYGGETGSQLEQLTDNELIERTMSYFRKFFGMDIPEPESFFNTRWGQDPFSYGSYSYLAVGSSGEDYEALAAPCDGRLFFAGEATSSSYLATTHGAYLSGIREANRIINL
ncbi:MAG: FAD-dependent oxidoreductase [Gammaproteobacteria bacterium]|nr:FAD-dependent oxidoreductase [Gammaproteobacteria bacterium]